MSKLIVSANSRKHLEYLLKKDIDGVIISIDKLSVNDSFYVDISELENIYFNKKEVFVSINKIMHNSDLEYLRDVLNRLKDKDIKILFYDMAVYNMALEFNMVDKLVICQDHLNASVLSNNFYCGIGIHGSYITSDITGEEILEIKEKTKMKMMMLVYGYIPIFYSRRYLISNYLKYIDKDVMDGNYEILSYNNDKYPIVEEEYGTTIYSDKVINLINNVDELKKIDYLVMRSNKIDCDEFDDVVDKFIKQDKITDTYLGFYDKKTIYKLK